MATIDEAGPSPRTDLTAQHAARVDACWPRVHVEFGQVTADAAGERVRALVQLGGLAPADVRVELVPCGSGAMPARAAREEHRMFSSQALGNGGFVFETRLPGRRPARRQEWLVRVHPSEPFEEPRVEHQFRSDL